MSEGNKTPQDNLLFKDEDESLVFNHYSFCELIKHIMVKYGKISYKNANEKLKQSFLINTPNTLEDVYQLTHELEYHWAMLLVHGNMYWTKGISSDINSFKDEYLAWEKEIIKKYNLKKTCEYKSC
ncbi:hypothetical protein [Tenacibaculum mesophilum]|uniref:hypothetical protein n=1 Tax=Tenacibaculum mesophilum TaxID=104268 RepID=UPI0012E5CDA5|nr:hypothetical protein [Tenacibaculum mesophilum]GFD83787.1 hypothetical protein KUL118_66490 [Tenacibaculum sp. KUL118]